MYVSTETYGVYGGCGVGAGAEEVQVDTGHTQPVCAVVYCPLLDQLVRGSTRDHLRLCVCLGEWV